MRKLQHIEIKRYEIILNKALNKKISYKEARNIIADINQQKVNFIFPKSNGDQININNIVGEKNKSKFVENFYKNLKITISDEIKQTGKNKGELKYYALMTDKEIKIRNKISKLTQINKYIFDSKNSIYKLVLNNIKQNYPKISTKYINRNITSGKDNTAANYVIEYKNNPLVLSYNRFEYSNIFNKDKQLPKNILVSNIKKKLKEINGLELIETINSNFKEDVINKILNLLQTPKTYKDRINELLKKENNIKKLKEIEDFIISIEIKE